MKKWWTSAFTSRFQLPPIRALRNIFGRESHRPPSTGERTSVGKSIPVNQKDNHAKTVHKAKARKLISGVRAQSGSTCFFFSNKCSTGSQPSRKLSGAVVHLDGHDEEGIKNGTPVTTHNPLPGSINGSIIVNRRDWLWRPANIKKANKDAKIYVGRSATLHNLLFCSHTLCMNYVTNTFLLVSSSISSKQILCFVQGQGQKTEQ